MFYCEHFVHIELFLFRRHAEIQGPSTKGEYSLLIVLYSYGIIHRRHLAACDISARNRTFTATAHARSACARARTYLNRAWLRPRAGQCLALYCIMPLDHVCQSDVCKHVPDNAQKQINTVVL